MIPFFSGTIQSTSIDGYNGIIYDRRKFRSQASDNMDRWKAEMGRVREEKRRKKIKEEKESKERRGARKGRKVACVFPMICGSGGSKSRLAKAAGAEPAGQIRDEKLHAVVARSKFPSQNVQTHHLRTTFGSSHVEKVHTVVARSTCPSQNVQITPGSEHFWKLRCRKSERCCGAKHISISKCTEHTHKSFGPFLEVEMLKRCTPLWHEAPVEIKSGKSWGVRSTFGRWDVVLRCRHKGFCTLPKVSKTSGYCSTRIFSYRHHSTTLHSTSLHSTSLHSLHSTHYTTTTTTTTTTATLH